MHIKPEILKDHDELTRIRRDIHAHPELGFEEHRTAEIVAQKLSEWGLEVRRGLGKTGVVGTVRRGNSHRAIAFRADMDALPILEANDVPHKSTIPGKMHACGHDGHTTMLLGAAKYLSQHRNFDGAVHFIFQPSEEGVSGAREMIKEGLFSEFPADAVFAIHNHPGMEVGRIGVKAGPLLAAADTFDITINVRGGHAAHPHLGVDPLVIASQIVLALQGIASRNIDPLESVVVTVGYMKGGAARNVIPSKVEMGGTVRTFTPAVRDRVEQRIGQIVEGAGAMHEVKIELDYHRGVPPTINHAAETEMAAQAAAAVCGAENVLRNLRPSMGAEDFSYMLEATPGAMVRLGNGPTDGNRILHNPNYDFNDEIIPIGVSFFAELAETFLKPQD
jgi:amidohydrolase